MREIVIGARGSGRTTELIRLASENDAIIVVRSRMEATIVKDKAELMECNIQPPISYDDFIKGNPNFFEKKFYIDNIEDFLTHVTNGSNIIGVSALTASITNLNDNIRAL